MSKKTSKTDIQQEVTDQIINLLDQVKIEDYQPPFAGLSSLGLPLNPVTNKRYQGINILSLWTHQQSRSFSSNQWATFKQWRNMDATVRKGEKASRIIFYKTLIKEEDNKPGNDTVKIPMLKVYNVFNADQVENYSHEPESKSRPIDKVEHIQIVDQFCQDTGAKIDHNGNQAYYDISSDCINMPPTDSFQDTDLADATENYYATLLHELTHWTGAKNRLNRFNQKISGDSSAKEDYALEELVAELGAAFLCAQHSITQTQPRHHAIYIKNWLKSLKENKSYIFKASAKAAKAVEYLNKNQPKT